jgi:hypothetical protein
MGPITAPAIHACDVVEPPAGATEEDGDAVLLLAWLARVPVDVCDVPVALVSVVPLAEDVLLVGLLVAVLLKFDRQRKRDLMPACPGVQRPTCSSSAPS